MRYSQKGFSLVELSIVLVILGLLVGGIMTGQNLIRAAELRSVTGEFNEYKTAVNIFQDKYFALPGDMPNAVAFWGRADDGTFTDQCADPENDEGSGTETCNGDGNGFINSNEMFRFWEHLANAGLINGTFSGVAGPDRPQQHIAGENCPAAKLGGTSGWTAENRTNSGQTWMFENMEFGNTFQFGGCNGWECLSPNLTPEEAWNLDTKMDDGKPGTGFIVTRSDETSGHPNCVEGGHTEADTAIYELDFDGDGCGLYFRNAF